MWNGFSRPCSQKKCSWNSCPSRDFTHACMLIGLGGAHGELGNSCASCRGQKSSYKLLGLAPARWHFCFWNVWHLTSRSQVLRVMTSMKPFPARNVASKSFWKQANCIGSGLYWHTQRSSYRADFFLPSCSESWSIEIRCFARLGVGFSKFVIPAFCRFLWRDTSKLCLDEILSFGLHRWFGMLHLIRASWSRCVNSWTVKGSASQSDQR